MFENGDAILRMQKFLVVTNVFTGLCLLPLILVVIGVIKRFPVFEVISFLLSAVAGKIGCF